MSKQKEVDGLKDGLDARPSITVVPDHEANYVRLKVVNNRGAGEFQATAQLRENGMLKGTAWPVRWRGRSSPIIRVLRGGHHHLDIASDDLSWGVPKERILRFHTAEQEVGRDLGTEIYKDEFDLPTKGIGMGVEIEVTITSDPPLQARLEPRCYRIQLLSPHGIQLEDILS